MAESNPTQVILTDDGLKIINAQKTADNAASGVLNLNDPYYMSVIEKQNNIGQFAGLTSQYNVLVQNAKDNGIDTIAVTTAYNNLNRFMADILADPNHASYVDRVTYKKYQDAYNEELVNLQNALQNNTNDKFTSAASALSQAASTANVAKSAADSTYAYANSEIAVQSTATAKAQSAADGAFSQAQVVGSQADSAIAVQSTATAKAQSAADNAFAKAESTASAFGPVSKKADSAFANAMSAQNDASSAVAKAESTASAFGPVSKKADSAFDNALSAQNDASNAVAQASSAAADSKDAKQIAGAVSQSYKTLTDGSTMTIAELQSGLAVKLTKKDLDGYATENWAQTQIKATADGLSGTISSVKNTVDSHTTSINDLKADSSSFKSQFTTVNDTLGKHTTDIGTLQTSSKELSSNFDSLNTDNKTNQHNISQLSQTVDGIKANVSKKIEKTDLNGYATQTWTDGQIKLTADGIGEVLSKKIEKTDLNGYATEDWAQNQIKLTADGINGTLSSVKDTVDSHTTSINDLKADSNGFKGQFTKVNDALGKHTADIGTLQSDAKSLSSNFDSLNTANGTNQHNISELQQTAKEFNSTLETVQTQVQNSAVGTNLLRNSRGKFQPDKSRIDNYIVYSNTPAVSVYMTQGQQYTVHADTSSGLVWSGTHNPAVESDNAVLRLCDSNLTINAIISDVNTGTGTTFTWNNPSGTYYLRVNTYKPDNSGYVENVKIEKGSLATDWCSNPADIATQSQITQLSGQIDQKVDSGDFSTYKTQTTNLIAEKVANSDFTTYKSQTADLISSKVETKDFSSYKDQTAKSIDSMVKSKDFESYKTQTAGMIDSKVSNSNYTSDMKQMAGQIEDKVSNGTFTSYKTQTANLIGSKVSNGDFTTYKSQTANLISAKVETKDFSSYKDETAKAISSKVKSSDFNTYKTQTDSAISSKVESSNFQALQNQVQNSAVGTNLLKGTSSDLQTAPDSHSSTTGGVIHQFNSDDLSILAGNQVTARAFIHNTTTHTVNLVLWTDGGAFGVGTGVPAGTDGYSTVTAYKSTSSVSVGDISIRAYTENTAISGVQYKELKLEKGSLATDWCPNPEDQATQSQITQLSNDINLRVKKGDLISEINMQAGNTLISSSKQLILSSKNILLDSDDPVIMKSANIDKLLVGKKLTAADISANTFSTNNGTFTVKQDGSITAKNMTLNGGKLYSPTINTSTINGSTINGTTFNGGDRINNPNNTAGYYPMTITPNGTYKSTYFDNAVGMQSSVESGAIEYKYRSMIGNGQYVSYNSVIDGQGFHSQSGYTSAKDSTFSRPQTITGYVDVTPATGIYLYGPTQQINFAGRSDNMGSDGITMDAYGNIYGQSNSAWWRIGDVNGNQIINFGIDKAGSNYTEFKRNIQIGNIGINTAHSITMQDGKGLYINSGKGGRADLNVASLNYQGSVSKSLLSEKKDVKKTNTAYWAQLVNSIDLATYQYKDDDNTSNLRLSGIVDDVNDTKQWQLPDVFVARDEDGKLAGIENIVLQNAMLATIQEQQKEIDKLNGHLLELEAKLNGQHFNHEL